MPQHATRYYDEPSNPDSLLALVSVDVKDHHRGFDWEAVNELAGATAGGVCKRTSRAGVTHVSDISIHPGPVES